MARTFSDKSSATSLTSSYYLQNFYYFNRNALKASYRKDYSKTELSYEDTRALKRAASKLSSFHYSKEENGAPFGNLRVNGYFLLTAAYRR